MLSPVTLDFVESHPEDAARIFEGVKPFELAEVLRSIPPPVAAKVMRKMAPSVVAQCLDVLEANEAAAMVTQLPTEFLAPLLRRLTPEVRGRLLEALSPKVSVPLRMSLRFPDGTVGSLIEPQVVTVRAEMSVGNAVRLARRSPELVRNYLYVIDETQRLTGTVDIRKCLIAPRNTPILPLIKPEPIVLPARMSLLEARENEAWTRFNVLPVVDRKNTFLGVLRQRKLEQALGERTGATRGGGVNDVILDLFELYWQSYSRLLLTTSFPPAPEVDR